MNRLIAISALAAGLISPFNPAHADPPKPAVVVVPSESCSRDLAVLPDFLLTNDTGAADNRRHRGESVIASALERATQEAASVKSSAECQQVLRRYLAAWREGHLYLQSLVQPTTVEPGVGSATQPSGKPKEVQAEVRWLSRKTVLLTFRTFDPSAASEIRDLLKSHRTRLEQIPHWIIDVRRNNGGSDSTYWPIVQAVIGNPILSIGVEFLSTPANIEANSRVCEEHAPDEVGCRQFVEALVQAKRAVSPGTYVRPPGTSSSVMRWDPDQPKRARPQRVAVLTDTDCASSCEQFLLAMRQGWNVKLMGRRTHGALDYSNLRPFRLPSGERVLWYATSRSARLPHLPVDATGVLPDVLLLPPANEAERAKEVDFVKGFLEGRAAGSPGG